MSEHYQVSVTLTVKAKSEQDALEEFTKQVNDLWRDCELPDLANVKKL